MEPSEFCYSPNYVIIKRVLNGTVNHAGYNYDNYRYNFATKSVDVFQNSFSTNDREFTAPYGTNVDAIQYTSNSIRYISTSDTNVVQSVSFGGRIILKIETNGVDTITYWIFRTTTQTVEVATFPTTIPCHQDISLPEDRLLFSNCDGYTRNEYYHDGEGGVNIVSTPNSSICGYVEPAENTDLTIEQLVRIEHCEPVNPVMLVWKNSLGGWDSWLFSHTQRINSTTTSTGTVGIPVWDIETAEANQKEIAKQETRSMILGAENLSQDEKLGISELFSSNIIYKVDKSGNKQRVMVKPGTFPILDTINTLQDIEFEIILPSTYTLSN